MSDNDEYHAAWVADEDESYATRGPSPPPSPPRGPPLPPSRAFLQHALTCGDEDCAFTRVVDCDVELASGSGENFLGELWRARVTLEDAVGVQRSRSLIVKRLPDDDMRGLFLNEAALFPTEATAYTQALPAMLNHLRRAYGGSFRPFWPQFIFATFDSTELVMDDMTAAGYSHGDRHIGLDLDQSKAVIKNMALLHAASVAMHYENQSSVFPFMESLFRESTRAFLDTYIGAACDQLATQLREWPGFGERYADRVKALEKTAWELVTIAMTRDELGFNVLNHGDLWVNNVMFRKDNSPSELDLDVIFLDWQNAVWTSPALDLLYFLYTSPTDEVRSEHADALLQLYHDTLQQAAHALNVGSRVPTLGALQADLKRRFALVLFPAFAELPNMLASPDLHYDIGLYFLENPPRNQAYGAEPYASVIRRLLPLFEKQGLL